MSFEDKFFDAAKEEQEETRRKNARIMASREAEAKRIPELAANINELSGTSAQLLRIIADRGKDVRQRLAELENRNLFLQDEQKRLLVKYGYTEDYLDPIYDCKLCRDTGKADGKRCRCFIDRMSRAAQRELNASLGLNLCRFEDFSLEYYDDTQKTRLGVTARKIMAENLSFCKNYAENFHIPCGSILMRGATGLGKTHLSLSIASVVLSRGYGVIYGSVPELLRKIEKEYYGSEKGDTLGSLEKTDLLVLDDVGAEHSKEFYTSTLYTILNSRINASLPMIVSTNYELSELRSHYSDRIISRLMTMENLVFAGNDIRIIKASQNR